MNKDLAFLIKVFRNAFILGGLMFTSTWATGTLEYRLIKPVLVFFLGYCLTELGKHYGVTKIGEAMPTLIFA